MPWAAGPITSAAMRVPVTVPDGGQAGLPPPPQRNTDTPPFTSRCREVDVRRLGGALQVSIAQLELDRAVDDPRLEVALAGGRVCRNLRVSVQKRTQTGAALVMGRCHRDDKRHHQHGKRPQPVRASSSDSPFREEVCLLEAYYLARAVRNRPQQAAPRFLACARLCRARAGSHRAGCFAPAPRSGSRGGWTRGEPNPGAPRSWLPCAPAAVRRLQGAARPTMQPGRLCRHPAADCAGVDGRA